MDLWWYSLTTLLHGRHLAGTFNQSLVSVPQGWPLLSLVFSLYGTVGETNSQSPCERLAGW